MSDRIVSDDGYYEWDGTAWVARPQHLWPTAAQATEPEPVVEVNLDPEPEPRAEQPETEPESSRLAALSGLVSSASPKTVAAALASAAVAGLALLVVGWTMFTSSPVTESAPVPSASPTPSATETTEPDVTHNDAPEPTSTPTTKPAKPKKTNKPAKPKKTQDPAPEPTKTPGAGSFSATGTNPSTNFDMGGKLFFEDKWKPAKADDDTFTITGLKYTDMRTDADRTPVDLEFTVYNGTDVLAEGTCKLEPGYAKRITPVTTCISKYPYKKDYDYTSFGVSW